MEGAQPFEGRAQAGHRLAEGLTDPGSDWHHVVALAPGGIPIAAPIGERLDIPTVPLTVETVHGTGSRELELAAVTENGHAHRFPDRIESEGIGEDALESEIRGAEMRAFEESRAYGGFDPSAVEGSNVIMVHEGTTTGGALHAAIEALEAANPARIGVAVPVGPTEALERLAERVHDLVVLEWREELDTVASAYVELPPVSQAEVQAILAKTEGIRSPPP